MPASTVLDADPIRENFDTYAARAKANLIAALTVAGAAHVCISYDGYGDEGAIGEVRALTHDCVEVALDRELDFPTHDVWNARSRILRGSLEGALTDFAECTVSHHYAGWENGDGALGEIEIDVEAGSFRLDHAVRVMTSENEFLEL